MNLATHPREDIACIGVDGNSIVIRLREETGTSVPSTPRKKGPGVPAQAAISVSNSQMTDEADEGGNQNAVRFSYDGLRIVTGGSDGRVRIWSYPELNSLLTIKHFKEEVRDVDFDPTGTLIAAVANTQHLTIWRTIDGHQENQLTWNPSATPSVHYAFIATRFGPTRGNTDLFTAVIPRGSGQPSYLVRWDTQSWTEAARVAIGTDFVTKIAVSSDGRFVATGDTAGHVSIFSAQGLQVCWSVCVSTTRVSPSVWLGAARSIISCGMVKLNLLCVV
eukprot:m.150658 g.150658  ORF g.150658 m.150658 type:complete len:277 (-) comp52801_c0_seq11:262-1092(-)